MCIFICTFMCACICACVGCGSMMTRRMGCSWRVERDEWKKGCKVNNVWQLKWKSEDVEKI